MEHIQNISNIIFDVKDNLTDGQFKTIMDGLGVVSKEVNTSNTITFDLDTPILHMIMKVNKVREFKRFGRDPLTLQELKTMVGQRITVINGPIYTIQKFTNISMILNPHNEDGSRSQTRRLIKLIDLEINDGYRFFPFH